MERGFLDFYGTQGGKVSDIDLYYDFRTGVFAGDIPSGGFFKGGNPSSPMAYNKVGDISVNRAEGVNLSGFYTVDGSGSLEKEAPQSGSFLAISDSSDFSGDSSWTMLLTSPLAPLVKTRLLLEVVSPITVTELDCQVAVFVESALLRITL